MAAIRNKSNGMGTLCRSVVSLFVAGVLALSVAVMLCGCEKKSGPQKAGERVGKNIEKAGKNIEKAADEAERK